MAEQKKMKLNYKLTFLIGFGFMASSIAWSVYNAYVPPILDEMLSASPTVAGIAEKLPWLATLFGGTDVVGAGVVGGLIGAIMVIDNVFGVIFQPLFGKISDRTHSRLGKRRPYLLFGIPAAALFFILIPRMPYIWTLMLCVICFNLIMSLWRSPVVALRPAFPPPSLRSEGNAVINLMGGLGTLLGMGSGMIVIAIMTLFMGSKPATDAERPYVFIFTAVVMLICLLVVMLTVKEPDSRLKKTAEANMEAEAKREETQKLKDLKLPKEHRPIGKYGRMHREYLREVHPVRLNTLTLTGELWTYLADLNEQAQERLDTIMEQMKDAEGVTEELKRTQEMEWVRRCNNIHNRAEEIILQEMIYS